MRLKAQGAATVRRGLLRCTNVYDVNPRYDIPETLQRRENYDPEGGLSEFFYTDVDGNELDYELPEGVTFNNVTGAFDVPQDVSGIASRSTLEGIPQPAIAPLTPLQQQGIAMGAEGIGAYEPYMQQADSAFQQGISSLQGTTGAYDPQSYKEYMDPYTQEVIDTTFADMDRQGLANMYDLNQSAIGSGAFGGSRGAVARQENARNIRDQKASFGAKLRSDAYKTAQSQAQSAFENQAKRGQSASQIFQGLGTAQAGLGQLGQTLATNDQQNVLGLGGLEQQQQQAMEQAGAMGIERAMEPFTRFSYMSDIAQGIPSNQSAMNTGGAPTQNTLGSTVGTAMGIAKLGQLRR